MSLTLEAALDRKRAIFLDSAPVIYALNVDPEWSERATSAIRLCIARGIRLVASPVTLAECLVGEPDPLKQRNIIDFLLRTPEIDFEGIDDVSAIQAGLLRQRRGWKLPDSLQMACALRHGCDGFLTNDATFANSDLAIDTILLSGFA